MDMGLMEVDLNSVNLFEEGFYRREMFQWGEREIKEGRKVSISIVGGTCFSWLPQHFDQHPVNILGREAFTLSQEGNHPESIKRYLESLRILMGTTQDIRILGSYRKNTFNNIGFGYIQLDNMDKAIEYLMKAKEIDPRMHFVNNNLGTAYENKGDMSRAKEFYVMELEYNPEHPTARQSLEKLSS